MFSFFNLIYAMNPESIGSYPSATLCVTNQSILPVRLLFFADENHMQFDTKPGFTEMRSSEHQKSVSHIHQAFTFNNNDFTIESVVNDEGYSPKRFVYHDDIKITFDSTEVKCCQKRISLINYRYITVKVNAAK